MDMSAEYDDQITEGITVASQNSAQRDAGQDNANGKVVVENVENNFEITRGQIHIPDAGQYVSVFFIVSNTARN